MTTAIAFAFACIVSFVVLVSFGMIALFMASLSQDDDYEPL